MDSKVKKFNMNYFSLEGKVGIVTGGNRGIGQAMAIALAKAGADLFIPTIDESNWEEMTNAVEDEGRKVVFYKTDLSVRENITKTVEECLNEFGKIDILINNAGIQRRASVLEFSDKDWNDVLNINLNAVFYMCKDVANVMAKQGRGKIINMASMLSYQGGKTVPAYTASKHGVVGITRSFSNELALLNIQVNAIAPGYIDTEMNVALINDDTRNKEILNRIAAGRWGIPSDFMGSVVFLASSASDYINGHVIAVDGGWLNK